MRRTPLVALAAVALAVTAAGCDITSEARSHWLRDGGQPTTVVYVAADSTVTGSAGRNTALNRAVNRWNAGLDQVTLVPYSSCPAGRNCVTVRAARINGGSTTVGYNADLHQYGIGARIVLTTDPTSQAVMDNIACHELGHALGLKHSPVAGVQGPCQNGQPTPHDLDQVDGAHGHQDVG